MATHQGRLDAAIVVKPERTVSGTAGLAAAALAAAGWAAAACGGRAGSAPDPGLQASSRQAVDTAAAASRWPRGAGRVLMALSSPCPNQAGRNDGWRLRLGQSPV